MRRLILAAMLVVAGCGNATPVATPQGIVTATTAPVSAAPTATTAPTVAPSPTPSLLTIQEAAAAYATIAKAYNKAVDAAYKKYGQRSTLAAQKKYWGAAAKAEDVFIDALKAIAFPADIQPDATRLVKAAVVSQRAALSASKSKTRAQLNERAAKANKADAKAVDLAAILRDDLGLPPNT